MSRTYRNIIKTKQCERFYNLSPRIYIYDLDGTIIDSSYRAIINGDGTIDLDIWKARNSREWIFTDTLLPLYYKLQQDYKNGDMVILCTAREMGKYDYEFIHFHNIYYDRIISRPKGNNTADHILKASQCRYLFNLPQYRKLEKFFIDDNENNLRALEELGATVLNAKHWKQIA